MKSVSEEVQHLSIISLESTYTKLLHAYTSTKAKGSSTTLIEKRLHAVKIGLESLKGIWMGTDFDNEEEHIVACKQVLQGILPAIEKQLAQAKAGSSSKTLNERRFTALQLAIESLENRLK